MDRTLKEMGILLLGALALLYLLNPTAGFFELLPDNIPFLGNIDEGLAVTVLLNVAAYYGFDVGRLFGRRDNNGPMFGTREGNQAQQLPEGTSQPQQIPSTDDGDGDPYTYRGYEIPRPRFGGEEVIIDPTPTPRSTQRPPQ